MANEEVPAPGFVFVSGVRSGQALVIPRGEHTIGRGAQCALQIDSEGVSRRHASVTREGDMVTIADAGSANGTWLNGVRLGSSVMLRTGDELRIGDVSLRFHSGAPGGEPRGASPARASQAEPRASSAKRRVRVGRVVAFGAAANLVVLAADFLIHLLTDWTGLGPWLAAPLAGMVASLVQIAKDAVTSPAAEPQAGQPAESSRPVVSNRRRVPIATGVVVAVLLIGVGGAGVAVGAGALSAFITGNQTGEDRLGNGPVEADSLGIVTTIENVQQTRDFTRVELTVKNNLGITVTLPLYKNVSLIAADGTPLEGDPFRSSWSDSLPPGGLRRGTIVFVGHLPDAATTGSFAVATVFRQGFEGPTTLLVEGLEIKPLA